MPSNRHPNNTDAFDAAHTFVRHLLDSRRHSGRVTAEQLYQTVASFNQILRVDRNDPAPADGAREQVRRNETPPGFYATRLVAMERSRERRRLRNHGQADDQQNPNTGSIVSITPPVAQSISNRRPRLSSPARQLATSSPPLTDQRRNFGADRFRNNMDTRRPASDHPPNYALLQMADFHHNRRQLESEMSNIRALLAEPIPSGTRTAEDFEQDFNDEIESHRASKRRKIDIGGLAPNFKELLMELESCDGGVLYSDPQGNYAASNVLKDDDSVYCTKGNRCNLVLKHQGGAPFCLQEINIRAPRSGFTAPVQEGMVFISMTADELFTRTAQYQIQYSPIRRSTTTRPIISARHNPDASAYDLAPTPPERAYRLAQIPSDFQAPTTQPFEVTTSCSDDDADCSNPAYLNRRRRRIAPDRIGSLRFEESDSDTSLVSETRDYRQQTQGSDSHLEDLLDFSPSSDDARAQEPPRHPPFTQLSTTLTDAIDAAQEARQEAVKAVGGGLMVPHARFFIERDKNRCTIRFDPPVSGRFVLLKMWSPQHRQGGNIDVQSVVVKGFAGLRTFPSITPV